MLLKIALTAAVLALAAYILFPVLPLPQGAAGFSLGTALGAFLAGLLLSLLGGSGSSSTARATADHEPGETQSVFVGNLAFKTSREELRDLFARYGAVHSVRIMTDRATRRPRGFGFVEMSSGDAKRAIKALDGQEFHGRALRVNQGNERRPVQNAA